MCVFIEMNTRTCINICVYIMFKNNNKSLQNITCNNVYVYSSKCLYCTKYNVSTVQNNSKSLSNLSIHKYLPHLTFISILTTHLIFKK
jgi:hypothetical protein